MNVVAFTGDADIWCPECAEERYGPDSLERKDYEGNRMHAVLPTKEEDAPRYCGDCGRLVVTALTQEGHAYVYQAVLYLLEHLRDYSAHAHKQWTESPVHEWLENWPLECPECGEVDSLKELRVNPETHELFHICGRFSIACIVKDGAR